MGDVLAARRRLVRQILEERSPCLLRPASQFLTSILADDALLGSMCLCHPRERSSLRNSVLIAAGETACWAPMLGNDPDGGRRGAEQRARLVLDGLDLSPGDLLERLRSLPIWFLAIEDWPELPETGQARLSEWTVYQMARLPSAHLRRMALMDQIDAALDARDHDAAWRIWRLLP